MQADCEKITLKVYGRGRRDWGSTYEPNSGDSRATIHLLHSEDHHFEALGKTMYFFYTLHLSLDYFI